jgi:hypothetical protein
MQKQLGLNKFYKTQTHKQRAERVQENIENGKRMMTDNAEVVRVSQQEQADLKESDIVLHIAEDIAKKNSIPLMDAMVEAQIEYQKTKV